MGYTLDDPIGQQMHSKVYKATYNPKKHVVAIKIIDLDRADLHAIEQGAKEMELLNHPNVLKADCSFMIGSKFHVVMPFISGGSVQSLLSSAFPNGLSEDYIAAILEKIAIALAYLHGKGHVHRDVKAGNILIDSNGNMLLADFGVSAAIHECYATCGSSPESDIAIDVAGSPYWLAPEVLKSRTGYNFKSDIWSFGITALELIHGRPPVYYPSRSIELISRINKRFQFSDHLTDRERFDFRTKRFSECFRHMVGLCLKEDPDRRPSARLLLKHPFFARCEGPEFIVENVLRGSPMVDQRFRERRIQKPLPLKYAEGFGAFNKNVREVLGWKLDEEVLRLNPVFEDGNALGCIKNSSDGDAVDRQSFKLVSILEHLLNDREDRKERLRRLTKETGEIGEEQMREVFKNLKAEQEKEKMRMIELELELEVAEAVSLQNRINPDE